MRRLIPLHHVGCDLAFREFPHAFPQLLLLFGKREFHDPSLSTICFSIALESTIYSTPCADLAPSAFDPFLCYTPAHAPPPFSYAFRRNPGRRPRLFPRSQSFTPLRAAQTCSHPASFSYGNRSSHCCCRCVAYFPVRRFWPRRARSRRGRLHRPPARGFLRPRSFPLYPAAL